MNLKIESKIKIWLFIVLLLISMGIVFGIAYFVFDDNSSFSDFGDYVGGSVSSVWSLAGLIIIYVAFLGQKEEIQLQKEQIELNRLEIRQSTEELRGQKKQLELQYKTMKIQNFESSFFNLLEMFNKVGDLIDRKRFYAIWDKLFPSLDKKENADKNVYSALYAKYYNHSLNKTSIDFFFRNFFSIIKLVDNSKIENKNSYIEILLAQLSAEEIFILYMHLTLIENKEWIALIEKHHLFRNISKYEWLVNTEFYNKKAFTL